MRTIATAVLLSLGVLLGLVGCGGDGEPQEMASEVAQEQVTQEQVTQEQVTQEQVTQEQVTQEHEVQEGTEGNS